MPVDVPSNVLTHLRSICELFPETYEERAWVGTRWRIRGKTFAHVLAIADGWPPAYAAAAADDGPTVVVMFRASGPELGVLRSSGRPFFAPPWRADEVGMMLDDDVDWTEVRELLTESYCALAPARLRSTVERPADED
jgi:hypothetical protein